MEQPRQNGFPHIGLDSACKRDNEGLFSGRMKLQGFAPLALEHACGAGFEGKSQGGAETGVRKGVLLAHTRLRFIVEPIRHPNKEPFRE